MADPTEKNPAPGEADTPSDRPTGRAQRDAADKRYKAAQDRQSWTRLALFLAVVLGSTYLYTFMQKRVSVWSVEKSVVAEAPAFRTLDGEAVNLADYRGKVVLLNLWATWCPPCRKEIPSLNQIQKRFPDSELVVLGVSVDELEDGELRKAASQLGVSYPVLRMTENADTLGKSFGQTSVIPQSWLIDPEGRIRAHHKGLFSGLSMLKACGRLVDES